MHETRIAETFHSTETYSHGAVSFDRIRALRERFKATLKESGLDLAIAGIVSLTVAALYIRTLVPSILDGDQGQFQYLPSVLGIPYPPGFPLYDLLGFLWSHIPLGTLAFRMNLLSAVLGAVSVGIFFLALRSQGIQRLASLSASLTLAVVPPFWEFSTWSSEHALNNLLTIILIAFLIQWLKMQSTKAFLLTALTIGVGLSNHPLFVLLAPATLVLLLIGNRSWLRQPRVIFGAVGLCTLPCLLYLLLVVRGLSLADSPAVLRGWSLAMAHGLVSVFFQSSATGWLRYFTASQFTGTLVHTWSWNTVLADSGNTLFRALNLPILALSLFGGLQMIRRRERIGIWLVLSSTTMLLVTPQFIYGAIGSDTGAATYFDKFFQPLFIFLIFLEAWGIDAVVVEAKAIPSCECGRVYDALVALVLSAVVIVSLNDLLFKHSETAIQRSIDLETKWETIKRYSPEPGSALIGHWGDLTPLWYYQTADKWRPDLVAFYPPKDDQIDALLAQGKPVYLAGSLLGWAPKTLARRHLTPWGSLVRVSQKVETPPDPVSNIESLTLVEDRLPLIRILGYDLKTNATREHTLDISVFWEALAPVPLDTHLIYFSLSAPSGSLERDTKSEGESLVVSWLSSQTLPPGQRALGTFEYKIPPYLPPARYQVNLFVYSIASAINLFATENAQSQFQIGSIRIDESGGLH